ncbi:MAG: 50S ribosomal protein L32 [Candidatus Obscuribacterales bacterium]|nr:50S ribosomal protein L32 [Candidatus Obscuribacterales bacterium]
MAQPKKKTSHQKQHQRRAHWKALATNLTRCLQCGAKARPHTMCGECGYYRGRPAFKSEQLV